MPKIVKHKGEPIRCIPRTVRLRADDWEAIAGAYPGTNPGQIIRSLVSSFVDRMREKAEHAHGLLLEETGDE